MKISKLVSICQRMFGVRGIDIAIGLITIQWMKHISNAVTLICFGGVAYLTESFGACLLLLGFGLWSFWSGLKEGSKIVEQEARAAVLKAEPIVSAPMVSAVKGLTPGRAIKFSLVADRVDFIVIEASDFDHIVDQAGMMVEINSEKSNGDRC